MNYICKTRCFFNGKIWAEGEVLDATDIEVEVPSHFTPEGEVVADEASETTNEANSDVDAPKAKKAKAKKAKAKKAKGEQSDAPADAGNAWDALEETPTEEGVSAQDVVTALLLDSSVDDATKEEISKVTDEAELRKIITFLTS